MWSLCLSLFIVLTVSALWVADSVGPGVMLWQMPAAFTSLGVPPAYACIFFLSAFLFSLMYLVGASVLSTLCVCSRAGMFCLAEEIISLSCFGGLPELLRWIVWAVAVDCLSCYGELSELLQWIVWAVTVNCLSCYCELSELLVNCLSCYCELSELLQWIVWAVTVNCLSCYCELSEVLLWFVCYHLCIIIIIIKRISRAPIYHTRWEGSTGRFTITLTTYK